MQPCLPLIHPWYIQGAISPKTGIDCGTNLKYFSAASDRNTHCLAQHPSALTLQTLLPYNPSSGLAPHLKTHIPFFMYMRVCSGTGGSQKKALHLLELVGFLETWSWVPCKGTNKCSPASAESPLKFWFLVLPPTSITAAALPRACLCI